jgi:hypothetical protein
MTLTITALVLLSIMLLVLAFDLHRDLKEVRAQMQDYVTAQAAHTSRLWQKVHEIQQVTDRMRGDLYLADEQNQRLHGESAERISAMMLGFERVVSPDMLECAEFFVRESREAKFAVEEERRLLLAALDHAEKHEIHAPLHLRSAARVRFLLDRYEEAQHLQHAAEEATNGTQ